MSVYFDDPQYVPGAPTEEAERIDTEIISKMKCCRGHPLQPELWHMKDGSSYIARGMCYICGFTQEI